MSIHVTHKHIYAYTQLLRSYFSIDAAAAVVHAPFPLYAVLLVMVFSPETR